MTTDLHFRKSGQGQPLMILHGLFGSSDNWQTIGKRLSGKFTVYLVDLRNHGHSPHTDEFSYELMCADLHQLITNENLSDIILLGHSMGAKVAMMYTQQFPEKISKLIVADMGIKKYPPHHQKIFEAIFAVDLNSVSSRKEAEEILKNKIEDQGVVQFLSKNLYWKEERKLAWRFNAKVIHEKIEEILVAVPDVVVMCETLFIKGGKSDYITENDWEKILSLFPNAKLETIAGSGHWVHAEAPQQFYNLLENFISH